jgi:hypothetical protein
LSTLPAVPEYWRWTPTEVVPFFKNPVSSTTSTAPFLAQVLHHKGAQVIADQVGIPVGGGKQPLHAVWGPLAGVLGQLPAILPRHIAQQPAQVGQRPSARLGAGEPARDAGVQGNQPRRPRLDFLNVCRLVGLQHRFLLPLWRVTVGHPGQRAGTLSHHQSKCGCSTNSWTPLLAMVTISAPVGSLWPVAK